MIRKEVRSFGCHKYLTRTEFAAPKPKQRGSPHRKSAEANRRRQHTALLFLSQLPSREEEIERIISDMGERLVDQKKMI